LIGKMKKDIGFEEDVDNENSKFEDLYYTAPGGERKLKRYVVAVLIIGVLMVAAIAWVIVQRSQIRAHMAYVLLP